MGNVFQKTLYRVVSWLALIACGCLVLGAGCPTGVTPSGIDGMVNDLLGGDTSNGPGSDTAGSTVPGNGQSDDGTNTGQPKAGDMDGDGIVGPSDVQAYRDAYTVAFGTSQDDPGFDARLDLDGDGQITFADLQALLAMVNSTNQ